MVFLSTTMVSFMLHFAIVNWKIKSFNVFLTIMVRFVAFYRYYGELENSFITANFIIFAATTYLFWDDEAIMLELIRLNNAHVTEKRSMITVLDTIPATTVIFDTDKKEIKYAN